MFSTTYALVFLLNLLLAASTMTIGLVSLQMELVQLNSFIWWIWLLHKISVFLFHLLNLDTTEDWFASHFKKQFLDIHHNDCICGDLFGWWRVERAFWRLECLSAMQLVSISGESAAYFDNHYYWFSKFRYFKSNWKLNGLKRNMQKGNNLQGIIWI